MYILYWKNLEKSNYIQKLVLNNNNKGNEGFDFLNKGISKNESLNEILNY